MLSLQDVTPQECYIFILIYIVFPLYPHKMVVVISAMNPGSSKKSSTKKFQHSPEAPGPPVKMLLILPSQ